MIRGLVGSDPIAVEALQTFIAWLGAFAGDAALMFGARGGVYLGGGIAPRIVEALGCRPIPPGLRGEGAAQRLRRADPDLCHPGRVRDADWRGRGLAREPRLRRALGWRFRPNGSNLAPTPAACHRMAAIKDLEQIHGGSVSTNPGARAPHGRSIGYCVYRRRCCVRSTSASDSRNAPAPSPRWCGSAGTARASRRSSPSHRRSWRLRALTSGVVCIGHPSAESGVGEALRGTARALHAADVPVTLLGLPQFTTARLQDRSMAAHESHRLGARANLLCDGLIGADLAVRALGRDAFAGRTNILRPFWELAKVPPRFAESLSRFQEIWAPSEFVREAFAASVERAGDPHTGPRRACADHSGQALRLRSAGARRRCSFSPSIPAPSLCARTRSPWSMPSIRPSAEAARRSASSSNASIQVRMKPCSSR